MQVGNELRQASEPRVVDLRNVDIVSLLERDREMEMVHGVQLELVAQRQLGVERRVPRLRCDARQDIDDAIEQ